MHLCPFSGWLTRLLLFLLALMLAEHMSFCAWTNVNVDTLYHNIALLCILSTFCRVSPHRTCCNTLFRPGNWFYFSWNFSFISHPFIPNNKNKCTCNSFFSKIPCLIFGVRFFTFILLFFLILFSITSCCRRSMVMIFKNQSQNIN